MAKRRVIKKVEMEFDPTVDEMLWPIHVSLVVLGCYLAGVVLAVFRFDNPDLLQNALTWLIIIPIVLGIAAVLVSCIESKVVRRSVLLSALLSLILHVTLMLAMFYTNIFGRPHPDSVAVTPEPPREVITVPDTPIPLPPDERRRQDYEEPVESGEPDETEEVTLEPERQSPTLERDQETAEPEETTPTEEPTPQVRRNVVETAPRRSESQATISRSQLLTRPQVATGSTQSSQPVANTEMSPVRPRQTEIARRQTPLLNQRQSVEQPESKRPNQTPRIARRQPDEAPTPNTMPAPTLPRSVTRPNVTPRTSITQTNRPSSPKQTSEEALAPSATAQRRQSTSPTTDRSMAQPAPAAIDLSAREAPRRQQQAEPNPQLASTTQRARTRTAVTTQPVVPNRVDTTQVTQAQPAQENPAPSASASQVARTAPQSPNRQRAAMQTPSPTATSSPAANTMARATAAQQPAAVSSQPRRDRSPRTATEANIVSSPAPLNVTSPAVATNQNSANQLQPSTTALSRSRTGTAGIGNASNLDEAAPAPDSALPAVASASARRVSPAQDVPGPAISPQQASRVRQTRSGSAAPNAVMPSEDVAIAQVVGSDTPSDLQASASAALNEARANAPRGVSATPGPVEVDIGPTRIVANTGQGRASGGGQPQLNFDPSTNQPLRSAGSSGMRPTVASTNVSEVAQSPAAGGESDALMEPTASAASQLAGRAGGSLPAQTSGDATPAANAPTSVNVQTPARAASIDAPTTALAEAGGGTDGPTRQLQQRPSAILTPSDVIEVAGLLQSSGDPNGSNLQAQGLEPSRSAAGMAGPITDEAIGSLADEAVVDGQADFVSQMVSALERTTTPDEDGPSPADLENLGGPIGRSRDVPLPSVQAGDVATTLDLPTEVDGTAEAGGVEQVADARSGPMSKPTAGSLPVEIAAPEGPGGLAADRSVDVGLLTRQSQTESTAVAFHPARFMRSDVGRPLPKSSDIAVSAPAFQRRQTRKGDEPDGSAGRPSPKTEAAIELGLVYLTKNQLEDGNWSLQRTASGRPDNQREEPALRSTTAATGLSLLSFLGAGYHHKEDQYAEVIRGGLEYLIQNQRDDGSLYVPQDRLSNQSGWMYSHAIATIALCEAYGMTQDPALREPAQRAIDFITAAQHPKRGGWRYRPQFGSDTSVSGWMMMALKSGQLAKLKVPKKTFDEIDKWLNLAQVSPKQAHLYRYNPYAPVNEKQVHGRKLSKTMTSVGLLMRLYSGWNRERSEMIRGADYLLAAKPSMGTTNDRQRDTYYWYYATQVMFHMGGDHWKQWNEKLHPLLVGTQVNDGPLAGSWNPLTPVPDRWGPHAGRLYVTTMNMLSLEVYYRHLPIYDDTGE